MATPLALSHDTIHKCVACIRWLDRYAAGENVHGPTVLALSRQNCDNLKGTSPESVAKGGYVIQDGSSVLDVSHLLCISEIYYLHYLFSIRKPIIDVSIYRSSLLLPDPKFSCALKWVEFV